MAPITILSLGGVFPFNPIADDGIICGMTRTPTAVEADFFRNSLLDDLCDIMYWFNIIWN
jgi:hypothetical protein